MKYKKCCLAKNTKRVPIAAQPEAFTIKMDVLTPEESKNDFPPLPPEDEQMLENLGHHFHEKPDTIDSEDCEYFQKLNALRAKYPGNPVILNYITNGYHYLGRQDLVEDLVAETYEKFPHYLFAQTAQAQIYLRDGFPEKAFDVLKGAHTLKQLYPYRTVFHISEVKAFESFMVEYFCEVEDFEQANFHLQVLQQILEEDDPLLQSVVQRFKRFQGLYRFKTGMSRLLGLGNKDKQL